MTLQKFSKVGRVFSDVFILCVSDQKYLMPGGQQVTSMLFVPPVKYSWLQILELKCGESAVRNKNTSF